MIRELIESSESIAIASHINPDYDALCSVLALYNALVDKYPKKSVYALSSYVPNFPNIDTTPFVTKDMKADLLITLDCASYERLNMPDVSSEYILNIDHHVSNTNYGDHNLVDIDKSSTCELLLDVFEKLDIDFSKKVGEYLYLGILTDTGHFAWNMKRDTFSSLQKIYEKGVKIEEISRKIRSRSLENSRLIGKVLSSFSLTKNGLLYIILNDSIDEYRVEEEHKEGIIEELKKVDCAKIVMVIKEEENRRVSLRSEDYNVSEIASKFGGGGHVKAAGFLTDLSPGEIIKKIDKEIGE